MPVGRPSLYKPEYCDLLIKHMESGLSFDTFAAVVGTCKDTCYEWVKVHSEFSDAKKRGTALRNLLVEKALVKATLTPSFKVNTPLLIFWVKNTLGWKEQTELSGNESAPIKLKYNIE